jgi:hypothetical protein
MRLEAENPIAETPGQAMCLPVWGRTARAGRIFDKGDAAKVMTSDTLTTVYGCKIVASAPPVNGGVYVLPHHTRGAFPT